MNKRILHLIQQAGMLLDMPRTHLRSLGNTPDTIASHSFHVAVMAYCIARMEGLPHEEGLKALSMGLFHDLLEARTGDVDFIGKNYTKLNEEKAIEDQFAGIEFGNDLLNMMHEYEDRQTLLAKCAKDADGLAQFYIEWLLTWRGNKLAEKWYRLGLKHRVPNFRTESAKKIALSMEGSSPQEWWWEEFVEKSINLDHLISKNDPTSNKISQVSSS